MYKIPVLLALIIFAAAISAEEPPSTEWHRTTIEEVFPGLVDFDGQIRYYKRDDLNYYLGDTFPTYNPDEFLASLKAFESEPDDTMKYLKAWIRNDSLKYLLYHGPGDHISTLCAFSPDTVDAINETNGFTIFITPVGVYRWVSIYSNNKLIRKINCCDRTFGCSGGSLEDFKYKGDFIYEITDYDYFPESGELGSIAKYKNYNDIDNKNWWLRVEYDKDGDCVFFESKRGFERRKFYCPRPDYLP